MLVTYPRATLIHRANFGYWEGLSTTSHAPPCTPGITDNSQSAWTDSQNISELSEQGTYEPKKTTHIRSGPEGPMTPYKWRDYKRSGALKVTAYFNRTVTTYNFLVGYPIYYGRFYRLCAKANIEPKPSNPNYCIYPEQVLSCVASAALTDTTSVQRQGDFDYWNSQGFNVVNFNAIDYSRVDEAIRLTRERVALKSFKDWDGLTDALQLKSTVKESAGLISNIISLYVKSENRFAASDLRLTSRIPLRKLLRSSIRAFRKIGEFWMAYRYTVMTSVYSSRDIMKLVDRKMTCYDRSALHITADGSPPSNLPDKYISKEMMGEIIVRSQVTTKYDSDEEAVFDRLGINPFVTAWEYIPFSFVADWFVNFGDYILARTNISSAKGVAATTSVRYKLKEVYTLHRKRALLYSGQSYGSAYLPCWVSGFVPVSPDLYRPEQSGVVRIVEYDTYDRSVFMPAQAVALRFDPVINWRRTCDSVVMTTSILKQIRNRIH